MTQQTRAPASSTPPPPRHTRVRLHWWLELAIVFVFYSVYSGIRNLFGSASVEPPEALANALRVIRVERALGLFQEQRIQSWFIDWSWFMRAWNIFYGTFHFFVTIGVLVWLFLRDPARYMRFRNVLATTTATALVGFSLFPLMPPRLLDDCTSPFGGCDPHGFVDSLARYGGSWSFNSGTMQSVSNQYAAMPSLHFGWSMWCCLAVLPMIRNRALRAFFLAYPWITLFAIVVTGNHYWLDAAGGAFALATGFVVGGGITRLESRVRFARMAEHSPPRAPAAGVDPEADAGPDVAVAPLTAGSPAAEVDLRTPPGASVNTT